MLPDTHDPDEPWSRGPRPDDISLVDEHSTGEHVVLEHVADGARRDMRRIAAEIGGTSPLLHYTDAPDTGIDITRAHPGSLPQFITGRSTLLSNLFRDEVALGTARRGAERVSAKATELHAVRGIDGVRLAVGMASWHVGDPRSGIDRFTAPVLLRPLALRRHLNDFELRSHGVFEVNPELIRYAGEHFGVAIDGHELASLAYDDGVFKPQPVIDWLRLAMAEVETFHVKPRMVVSTFADVGQAMARDLGDIDHPVLNAIAGHDGDRDRLQPAGVTGPLATDPDQRPPASDALILDADREQEEILARIVAGESFAVQTLPGTGGTQTIINAIGELTRAGKRVLVVSARGATLDGIRHRMQSIGLAGMPVSTRQVRRDLIRAIGRNEQATEPDMAQLDDMLVKVRGLVGSYRAALQRRHDGPDATPLEAVERLAEMAMLDRPPSTTARLSREAVAALRDDRAQAAQMMTDAARLGEFRIGPEDSPWYGVSFESTDAARAAHALAGRLSVTAVPRLLERGYELNEHTTMRPFRSVAELGEYLELLIDIRQSLDRFQPTVFDRPLGDLIEATGPRRDSNTPASTRRRLKRVAREYLRPGVQVNDLHAALVDVQKQRVAWRALVDNAAVPELPLGLSDVWEQWQEVNDDLATLDRALGHGSALAALPLAKLVRSLAGLAAESDVFDNIVERAHLRSTLLERGLDPLLTELSKRHVEAEHVGAELEFAWWQSALEHMVRDDSALFGSSTSIVDSVERDFNLLDETHAARAGALLTWQLAQQWRIGIVDEPAEADALRTALKRGDVTPADVIGLAPSLTRVLAPVWMSSPYDVPLLPEGEFDAVLFADAGSIDLIEAAPAIRRSRQVVAFGDPVVQRPTSFAIAAGADAPAQHGRPSLFASMQQVTGTATLTKSYRAGGEDLAELVNDAFYGGQIQSLPWAGSYLGRGSISVDLVEGGRGTPDPETGAVESPDAEVQRVVTLTVDHAVHRPSESLMIISASKKHADRVRTAVNAAFSGRSDVADFLTRTASEALVVLPLEQAVSESRDRVIFSLGYGLTKHGRVLSDVGELSTPDGERLLTVSMTRARRAMTIVSSIAPGPGNERLEHGAATFMDILQAVMRRRGAEKRDDSGDPLSVALARELRALGVSVDVGYHGALPLVAKANGRALAIYHDRHMLDGSIRETVRLRVQTLRRLGWHFIRVHAFDVYSDPALTASRIAHVLGLAPGTPRVAVETDPLGWAAASGSERHALGRSRR